MTIKPEVPSLQLSTPVNSGLRFVENLTPYVENYRSSRRLYGGYWKSTWNFINMSPPHMRDFFNRRLAFHLKEKSGANLTWEGLIWEMEFTDYGVTRRMSLSDVRNSVKCTYTDTADDTRKETSWYKNTKSIAIYGEIQETVFLDNVTASTAQAYAQTILAEQAFPFPNIVAVKNVESDRDSYLSVTAVGYAFTMNNKYLSIAGGVDSISNYITSAISADCAMVSAARIDANAVTVDKPNNEIKTWDWLVSLAEIGDGTSPYRLYVGPNRKVVYEAISPKPTLHWFGQKLTRSVTSIINVNKWDVQPGVIRDHTWPRQPLPSEMFLEDARDAVVTEVEIGVQYPIPLLKTAHWLESEFLSTLEREKHK